MELLARYTGPLDLLVTDLVMPLMSGQTLAGLLTGQRPGLRCLFVSGYAPADPWPSPEVPRALLQKPFTPAALAAKIREVLGAAVG